MSVFLSGLLVFGLPACSERKQPVDYVNPFICTQGDHGQWMPVASVPFGMVTLGPDSYPGSLTADGNLAHGGYDYSDHQVRGFSHMHKGSSGGTEIRDRSGRISIVPFSGTPEDTSFYTNPVLDMDKASEKAEAGYYAVELTRDHIRVELTATPYAGMHRYTFPEGKDMKIFLNAGRLWEGISCTLKDEYTLEGELNGNYFVLQSEIPIRKTSVWDGQRLAGTQTVEAVPGSGIICEFESGHKVLQLKMGLSFTGIGVARENLESSCPGWDFDRKRKGARTLWNDVLKGIRVRGSNEDDKAIFYTALYHTCLLPVVYSDVAGTYRGSDCKVHRSEGYRHYGGYAFWDSFRTKYPLYSLYLPSVYRDIVYSLRDLYEQTESWGSVVGSDHHPHKTGFVAQGNGCEIPYSCRHEHMLMVVSDAFAKGLSGVDMQIFYPWIRREALLQMPEEYDTIGYIPSRPDQIGEYCWDNWNVAQMAKTLGDTADHAYFMKRAQYWKNAWDPELRFFRARAADSTWLDFPDDPTVNREKYTYEGSKWHWRWNVIHDLPGLIDIFGGKEAFLRDLEYFFEHDLYTAGNQIDLQAPFLFNNACAPWLTQKWVRKILTKPIVQKYGTHDFFPKPIVDRVYKNAPDGYLLEMDDDYGCMAAWYAMAAMGLYQVCPGNTVYNLTAPVFNEVDIRLDPAIYSGNSFRIRAHHLSDKNIYIQSAKLNGQPYESAFITHERIVSGGELVFEMGPEPNRNWGTSANR